MKVLVCNPPFCKGFCRSARWAAKSRGRVQRHPDWLLIAVGVLERAGHIVLFIDGTAQNLSRETVIERARDFRPDLAVLHTTTPTIYSDIDCAKGIKQATECKIALIGYHVTAEPQDTLRIADGSVDHIVSGEYDNALLALADGRTADRIVKAPVDVKQLPFPAWRHIDPRTYRDFGKRYPFLTLISGRGCSGRCTFCTEPQTLQRGPLRLRDAVAVVDEMEYDFRMFPALREIMFETDTFTASPAHVRGICEEILRRNLRVTFSVNARADMDLSLLPLMKRAGCRMLMVGFEFGTQEALDAVNKGISLDQSSTFALAARKLGFTIHGCFMFGAPGETVSSARATIDFAKSLPLDTAQFSGICVYPGTALYTWAKENGYLVPKDWREWVGKNGEQVTLLSYPGFSKDQIDASINRGLRLFYLRPKQILNMLFSAHSFSDIARKVFGFSSFLKSAFGKG
jgi:anaerobic magnesium-protoporphyrin IX monomethyl ester cyclase